MPRMTAEGDDKPKQEFRLFGTYSFIISSIKTLNFFNLFIISLASLIGISSTSILLKKALERFYSLTMSSIIGIMIGTIPGLFVSFTPDLLLYNLLSLVFGIGIVWCFDYLK